ncbi:hypothetical protein ElyMa_007005000 [Elysia marginata]|uniref:Uncharacterized protein n=1 Tax=Elysia marginata TaxID=1093978 RepID=A0AAV4JUA4_9GAST|nr:hypothetical protein ElyMa_007005000 [Elysia marginata]
MPPGVVVATSIDHHLAWRHGIQMGKRQWHCHVCQTTMTGLETREHRCGGRRKTRNSQQRSKPPRSTTTTTKELSPSHEPAEEGETSQAGENRTDSPAAPQVVAGTERSPSPRTKEQAPLPGGDDDSEDDDGVRHEEGHNITNNGTLKFESPPQTTPQEESDESHALPRSQLSFTPGPSASPENLMDVRNNELSPERSINTRNYY